MRWKRKRRKISALLKGRINKKEKKKKKKKVFILKSYTAHVFSIIKIIYYFCCLLLLFIQNTGGNCIVAQQPIGIGSRRILSTAQSQLRSPAVKRPASAPVAMQGWLHKQGSEGLMLWKKRWFVLSEYCLFYYKSKLISGSEISGREHPCNGLLGCGIVSNRIYKRAVLGEFLLHLRTSLIRKVFREIN